MIADASETLKAVVTLDKEAASIHHTAACTIRWATTRDPDR